MDSGWIKAVELPAKITGGLFVGAGIVLLIDGTNALNLTDIAIWARPLCIIIFILSGSLFIFSVIPEIWKTTEGYRLDRRRRATRQKYIQEFIKDIPYMTEEEKTILGYLSPHSPSNLLISLS